MFKIFLAILLMNIIAPAQIYSVNQQFEISSTINPNQLAHALWEPLQKKTGWNRLYIYTNANASPLQQHQAAGFIEGYITYEQIYSAYLNFINLEFEGNAYAPEVVQQFLQKQILYLDEMIKSNQDDIFWQYIGYYLEQVRFMHTGYLARIKRQKKLDMRLQFEQFYYLTSIGDLEDLLSLATETTPQRKNCNAYIRYQNKKLDVVHATHNRYSFLLRIFKTWSFPRSNIPMQKTSFTSRPGDLISKDDFFILDSGLRVLQTSLINFIKSNIYEVSFRTAPSWIRTLVANHLSSSTSQWMEYFNISRSGTHNNQWIIVDTNRLGEQTNFINFFEEGFSVSSKVDMSKQLLQVGYIAGYNMPFTKQVFYKLGWKDEYGNYRDTDRAKAFQRIHPLMKNIEDMKYYLLQHKQQIHYLGLAPRYDLLPQGAGIFGLTDCKIALFDTLKQNYFWAISGPTTSNGTLPVFDWKNWENYPHYGLPQVYDFGWYKIPLDIKIENKNSLMIDI